MGTHNMDNPKSSVNELNDNMTLEYGCINLLD
jgi:hypothetical protein